MKEGWLARALVPLAAGAALATIVAFPIYRCPIGIVTHEPCPTCGITRAVRELLHLHFAAAWAAHPLVFFVVPYVALLAITETRAWVARGEIGTFLRHRAARVSGFVLCVLLFAVWVARFCGAFGGKVPL